MTATETPVATRVLTELLTAEMKRWAYVPTDKVLAQRAQVIVDALRDHPNAVDAFLEEITGTTRPDPSGPRLTEALRDLARLRAWLDHEAAGYATHVRIDAVRWQLRWST